MSNQLKELKGSGFEIADGEPNILGWDIKDQSGNEVGDVKDLLFDESTMKVRYIITKLNNTSGVKKHVLIPIGVAELHSNDDYVTLPSVSSKQLATLPEYEEDNLTPDMEMIIRNTFSGTSMGVAGDDFYNHEHFDNQRLYNGRKAATDTIPVIQENLVVGAKEVENGGFRITSKLTEVPVEETLRLKEEHVSVTRTPVDRPLTDAGFAPFEEGVIELTETAEIPVITKEARVVEEVTIGKDVNYREEIIRDTVKNTEVDVEKIEGEKRNGF